MTWRNEPVTKGELVDALEEAIKVVEKGTKAVLDSYPGMPKVFKNIVDLQTKMVCSLAETVIRSIKKEK